MKLQGEVAFEANRETVWDALNNPEVIAKCLPGCESMEPAGEDVFEAVLKFGVGPITGQYRVTLKITDKNPPQAYALQVDGSGKPGFVKGQGSIKLQAQDGGGAVLRYDGDLQIGGLAARIGQRMIGTISKQLTKQFFSRLVEAAESTTEDSQDSPQIPHPSSNFP